MYSKIIKHFKFCILKTDSFTQIIRKAYAQYDGGIGNK